MAPDRAHLAQRLESAIRMPQGCNPAIRGQTRREADPARRERRRPDARSEEKAVWDRPRIDAFPSRGVWRRQVSKTGQISLSNRNYRVGCGRTGREVSMRFDVAELQWVGAGRAQGQEWARHVAEQITRERIMNLNVMHRRIDKKSDSPA